VVELDVISGFLGAGKTTLANMLLKRYIGEGERAVFIVNEFGEVDTDATLIRGEGFTAIELVGGCVCCTLRVNLVTSLREVIETFQPTKIVFETSGIFVYDQFESVLRDEFLKNRCRVRRTVAVADSLIIQRRTALAGSFIENQMKNASVIVLSKLERFSGDVDGLVCDIKAIAPKAIVLAYNWDDKDFLDVFLSAGQEEGHAYVGGHGHAHFDAVTLDTKDMSQAGYERFIAAVLSGKSGDFLRVKGAVRIDGKVWRLNIAMGDVVLQPARESEPERLTFIGNGFSQTSVIALLIG
jgi:G3E family GTPase